MELKIHNQLNLNHSSSISLRRMKSCERSFALHTQSSLILTFAYYGDTRATGPCVPVYNTDNEVYVKFNNTFMKNEILKKLYKHFMIVPAIAYQNPSLSSYVRDEQDERIFQGCTRTFSFYANLNEFVYFWNYNVLIPQHISY